MNNTTGKADRPLWRNQSVIHELPLPAGKRFGLATGTFANDDPTAIGVPGNTLATVIFPHALRCSNRFLNG